MANFNGVQAAKIAAGYPGSAVPWSGARVRMTTDTLVYAAQASGSTLTMGAVIPAGALIGGIWLATDTSTATATLAFGDGTTANKFAAAAAYTTVNTWVNVANVASGNAVLTVATQIVITTATAALPGAGNLIIAVEWQLD